jgi:hypothetical protein
MRVTRRPARDARGATWYVAQLVASIRVGPSPEVVAHVNYVLVRADDAPAALAKATALGKARDDRYDNPNGEDVRVRFLGLRELCEVYDPIHDGTELLFTEYLGLTSAQARAFVRPRSSLAAFREERVVPQRMDYASGEVVEELVRMKTPSAPPPRSSAGAALGLPPEVQLARLARRMTRLAGPDDDWSPGSRWGALQILPAEGRATRSLYVTKLGALLGLDLDPAARNRSLTLLSHYGVPSNALMDRIASECPRGTLDFVGDLDPLDLTVFLCLASRLQRRGVRVRHVGVGGEWIDRCRRHRSGKGGLPLIRMTPFERRQWAMLRALSVSWDAVVGAQATALLDAGTKLELEGATNPGSYAPVLTTELQRELFGRRGPFPR